ncbi:MAG: hypothetical protein K2H93_06300, partial [Oscillospiraceae bacterium]|nr:hypothetical protein [Oscillospiraceae bacterium]
PWDDSWEYTGWSGMTRLVSEANVLKTYMPHLNITNRFFERIPLEILYFGIADIAEAIHDSVFLLIAPIIYSSFFLRFFLDKYYEKHKHIGRLEAKITNYVYDNIVFYLISIPINILKKIDGADWLFLDNFDELLNAIFNKNPVINVLIGILFIIVIAFILLFAFLPMLAGNIYFFGYILMMGVMIKFIKFLNESIFSGMIEANSFCGELLVFIIAFALIFAVNLVADIIYELLQKISLLPARLVIKKSSWLFHRKKSKET